MKARLALVAVLAAAVVSGLTLVPAASAATCTSPLKVPLTGTFVDAAGNAATYKLCYTLKEFTKTGSGLTAVGTVRGTATDTVTGVTQDVSQLVFSPARIKNHSCTILDLTIRPIDLNLLGLMVHTDTIHIEITAQEGGGLLGDLLCSLDNLLNNGGNLKQVIVLLNEIIGQL